MHQKEGHSAALSLALTTDELTLASQSATIWCVRLATDFIPRDRLYFQFADRPPAFPAYSTVTLLARLRGLSTSVPRTHAVWYDSSCSGIVCTMGESAP